ncbi:hypothetical protein [Vulgatibacter sp.]|uniref:hypothetical protein n=1 Tax=Vulgatibacter sp. TaxID=1971226 RepID=UPI003561D40F
MRNGFVIAALLFAVGCSGSDGGGGAGGAGGTGATGGAGGSGGTGGAGGTGGVGGGAGWEVPTNEVDTGWTPEVPAALDEQLTGAERPASCTSEYGFVDKVRGWVAAPGGEPIEGAKAQLCVYASSGTYVCLQPSETGADGVYTIDVPDELQCFENIARRVLKSKIPRATSYCEVDKGVDPVAMLRDPTVLPFLTPVEDLPPLGDEETARDVVFDDGLVMEVTPSLYYSGVLDPYEKFAARRIPREAVGLCGEANTFDGLYAFYPEGSISAPGYALEIPNATDLPAGSTVELFVLGGLECHLLDGTKVPEAVWAKFGEGTVSTDGATIETAPGAGMPCMTWLAYRSKE